MKKRKKEKKKKKKKEKKEEKEKPLLYSPCILCYPVT